MNKSDLRLDYLKNHPELKLYQSKEMFRINTDTCLLGEFFKCKENDSILDVGTNNGALLIYASKKTKGKLIGVDINNDALEIAKINMELHNISNYELINEDFTKYQNINKFDVIIANPPYFNTVDDNSKNLNIYLRNARHEEFLKLKDLVLGVKRNLSENGYFYLVHRPDREKEIVNEFENNNLFVSEIVYVKDLRSNKIVTLLFEFKNNNREIKKESVIEINGF